MQLQNSDVLSTLKEAFIGKK